MSDVMRPLYFRNILDWILTEYSEQKTIFGIPFLKFYFKKENSFVKIFDKELDNPIGPAAGPHTQLAQNIVAAYITGSRFFELKTVQKLDQLKIEKPCIDAEDEGYNIEWSQELTLEQSYNEYLKAWFLLHFLNSIFSFSTDNEGYIFNISVGYNLEGIKSLQMDSFIEKMKDASVSNEFDNYKKTLSEFISRESTKILLKKAFPNKSEFNSIIKRLKRLSENISPFISNSVTLSTMHGCPPDEIESIAKYLMGQKQLHTYIKLNPTLLGFKFVKDTLFRLGYNYIELEESSFSNDLKFCDAIPLLKKLKEFSVIHKRYFGIKLSNTLGVKNTKGNLPGNQMYMSGRSLYALTINLAYKIAEELKGEINISYSGGASINNITQILETGILPVTFVTELLKPGGYLRLFQIAEASEKINPQIELSTSKIDLSKLKELAVDALLKPEYKKDKRIRTSLKINKTLPRYDCYISPCSEVCPVHQDVAEYISLVKDKKYDLACEVITLKNPLPNITGYICDHQCVTKCSRWDYENAISIRELKKEAAEKGLDNFLLNEEIKKNESIGIKAAIIGAGPAGLSAAYFLAKAGFEVTIFEKTKKAGGTVQHVIPNFRLPQSAIERDINFIKKLGVTLLYGSDSNFSVSKLKSEDYKYIFIGIGATKSNNLNLGTGQIFNAIEFLTAFNKNLNIKLGKNVAVIGGGNSAMDSARASLKLRDVKKVYIIYRRTLDYMPADKEEVNAALYEGAILKELLLPVAYQNKKLKCQIMQLGEIDEDGRRKVFPVENKFEEFEIDSVISAIGEHVDLDILRVNNLLSSNEKSLSVNNDTNETIIENVFIGGDALRGPSTVIDSIADGKKAAEAIIKKEKIEISQNDILTSHPDKNFLIKSIENKRGIVVTENYSDVILEANRCLECNLLCNKCVEVCPNRANVVIKSDLISEGLKDYYQILHLDGLCNECGNCETFCPYSSAPYKVKTTLFWSKEDFSKSENEGFYYAGYFNGINKFEIRFESQIGNFFLDKEGKVLESSINFSSTQFETFKNYISTIFKKYNYLINSNNNSLRMD